MSATTTHTPALELLKQECNRHVHGQCSVRRCLVRGGAMSMPDSIPYGDRLAMATCEYHEAVLAIWAKAELLDVLREVERAMFPDAYQADDPDPIHRTVRDTLAKWDSSRSPSEKAAS